MRYNAGMNVQPLTSLLTLCLVAAALLFSLWVGCAQSFCSQDVIGSGHLELTLGSDIQVDDADNIAAIISSPARTTQAPHRENYPKSLAQVVLFNCFSPPDRPPILAA